MERLPRCGGRPMGTPRYGYTLIEVLVVITIILILAGLTLATVNFGIEGDRLAGGARQVQGMSEGARDRAIYAGRPRGVRFIRDALSDGVVTNGPGYDPSNPAVVTSLVYTGAPEPYSNGKVYLTQDGANRWIKLDLEPPPPTPPPTPPTIPTFTDLASREMIPNGGAVRMQLKQTPNDNNGPWFTVALNGGSLFLSKEADEFVPPGTPRPFVDLYYQLILNPGVLPNQEPKPLPRNVVIDLFSSYLSGKMPQDWYSATPGADGKSISIVQKQDDVVSYATVFDVPFNSRGTVEGRLASQGVIHLVVADLGDVARGFNIGVSALKPNASGGFDVVAETDPDAVFRNSEEVIISIFTRTGTVAVSDVDVTDADNDGYRDDPFLLAEGGAQ